MQMAPLAVTCRPAGTPQVMAATPRTSSHKGAAHAANVISAVDSRLLSFPVSSWSPSPRAVYPPQTAASLGHPKGTWLTQTLGRASINE